MSGSVSLALLLLDACFVGMQPHASVANHHSIYKVEAVCFAILLSHFVCPAPLPDNAFYVKVNIDFLSLGSVVP